MFELRPDLATVFTGPDPFERIMALEGAVFRELGGRRTLRFEVGGRGYFLKAHFGVGWREIAKNLLHLRRPVLGAKNEKLAIERLQTLGLETMAIAGYGIRGLNPACRQSFLITDELTDTISLEDFCRPWATSPPPLALKRALIEKVAKIARRLHLHGVNHRDFYLCHFLLQLPVASGVSRPEELTTFLIDLHRVQLRQHTPFRWRVKDIAGLYFSSLDIGLSRRDVLRFMRCYSGMPLSLTCRREHRFWQQVGKRAVRLYERDFGRTPRLPV